MTSKVQQRSSTVSRSKILRIIRLSELIRLGLAGHNPQLALELGVSGRTVARDMALLRDAGLPIVFDETRNGYRLLTARGAKAPGTLSTREIESLFLAVVSNNLPSDSEELRLATAAIIKLSASLPLTNGLLAIPKNCPRSHSIPNGISSVPSAWDMIVSASREHRALRLQIRSNVHQITTKISEPRLTYKGQWLVSGRSSYHRAHATIPLREIQHVELVTYED